MLNRWNFLKTGFYEGIILSYVLSGKEFPERAVGGRLNSLIERTLIFIEIIAAGLSNIPLRKLEGASLKARLFSTC